MRTYYFDMRDGVPTRDRKGVEFASTAVAIAHSKELARRLRDEPRIEDPELVVVVVDESGAELHRERVYPDAGPRPDSTARQIGNFDRID